MPALPVVFTRRTARQVEAAAEWWRVHRPGAPDALRDDLAAALALIADQPACGAPIDAREVASSRFMGFGAQWDATAYTPNGVTEQDDQIIEKRIRWMRLPVVRKMMLTRWALVAEGMLDFDTHEMALLYRQLDV